MDRKHSIFESDGCAFDPRRGHLLMPDPLPNLQLIRMLSERLERISADSVWAHRASGVRGSLLRILDESQNENPPDPRAIADMITISLNILTHAAKRD
jgi:hypothetical protein